MKTLQVNLTVTIFFLNGAFLFCAIFFLRIVAVG